MKKIIWLVFLYLVSMASLSDAATIYSNAALAEAPAANDLAVIIDTSDTTMSANGTDKKITITNLLSAVVGTNEIYGAGWNADTGVPEKDDIYDYLHQLDTDDDGDVDNIDFTTITLNDFTFDVGSVDKTEFGYLNGVTSAIQDQLNGMEADTHASEHAVSAADTIFPVDPNADRYLMWDDDPGALVWATVSGASMEDVAYNVTTWDSDTDGASKNVLRDYFALFDSNGDGTVDQSAVEGFAASATPKITLDDSDGADGYWDVNAADANDAVATLGVDDSTGDDVAYVEFDGVNERIETKKPLQVEAALTFSGSGSIAIPSGTDPNVDAAGEIAQDTDGADEASDVSIRAYDGTNQFLAARKLKEIHCTVIAPNDLADSERDQFPVWDNNTGMVFTITEIKAWSDTDDTTVNVEVVTATNWGTPGTVDALEIATNGTGVFYVTETTITDATIAHDEMVVLDFDDTDTPGMVKISIYGWFNAGID